jgi:hypothetical protein
MKIKTLYLQSLMIPDFKNIFSIIPVSSKINHILQLIFILDINLIRGLLLTKTLSSNYIEEKIHKELLFFFNY